MRTPKYTLAVTSTQENKEQYSKEAVKVSTDILVMLRLQILIGRFLSETILYRYISCFKAKVRPINIPTRDQSLKISALKGKHTYKTHDHQMLGSGFIAL